MIDKNELLKISRELGLNPETVEKDYVLGWLLYGINKSPHIGKDWVFKGGTSLKKCFFETFRFSEDLDFTVRNSQFLEKEFLVKTFAEIIDFLSEEVGIEFIKENIVFDSIQKEGSKISVEGKIHYNGPVSKKGRVSSIKLDLTDDELIVLNPVQNSVFHPYSDEPTEGVQITTYAFEEVVAEKIRALAQRARPRDLYDVIHFFRNRSMIKNPTLVYNTLIKKCEYKGMSPSKLSDIESHEKISELESEWENMLAHQLPALPPLESFWNELEPFFDWLEGQLNVENLVTPIEYQGRELVFGRYGTFPSVHGVIPKIQFAAANRVCVILTYKDKNRIVEPLSFRTTGPGNKVFYGYEREGQSIKAYRLDHIQGVHVTNQVYREKYPIEISASGSVAMPPLRRRR